MINRDSAVMYSGHGDEIEFGTLGSVIDAFICGNTVKLYDEYKNSFQRIVSVKSQPVSSDSVFYALRFETDNDSEKNEFKIIVSDQTYIGVISGEYVVQWISVSKLTAGMHVSSSIKLISCTKQGYNGVICNVLTDCGYFIVNGVAVQC